jgi:hypothetical protein
VDRGHLAVALTCAALTLTVAAWVVLAATMIF